MVELCENSKRGVKMGFQFPILSKIKIFLTSMLSLHWGINWLKDQFTI